MDRPEVAREQGVILLESANLRLRRFTAADLDLLVELDSDPQVMRWISDGVATPRERYECEILPRWFAQYEATPLLGYWAAETRVDGAFVGWFHLRPDRIDVGEQELGYRLRRAAWGRGLATEGSLALLDHGFRRAGAGRISARTLAGNRASQRVMQKCGLQYERDFLYPEDVIPGRSEHERAAVKYALDRDAWFRRPA